MVITQDNNKLIAYVNTGIAPSSGHLFFRFYREIDSVSVFPFRLPGNTRNTLQDFDRNAQIHGNTAQLVAETNSERTRSPNEIAVGTHGFQLADGVTDFDGPNLRASECDHFSEFTCSDKFNCCCTED
jgi:hypothetical protein